MNNFCLFLLYFVIPPVDHLNFINKKKKLPYNIRNIHKSKTVDLVTHKYPVCRYRILENDIAKFHSRREKYFYKNQNSLPNKFKFNTEPREAILFNKTFTTLNHIYLKSLFHNTTNKIGIHVLNGKVMIKAHGNKKLNHQLLPNHSYYVTPPTLNTKTYLRVKPGKFVILLEAFVPFEILQSNYIADVPTSLSIRSRFACLDCEFASVGYKQSALTSVSIIDEHCNILLNTLVSPVNRVKFYVYHITGLNDSNLRGSMDEIRAIFTVQRLLQNRILVGSGLTNDLKVLLLSDISSTNIIDLAISNVIKNELQIFNQFTGLKTMAENILNINVQASHHTSLEDAETIYKIFIKFKQDLLNEFKIKNSF